MFVRTTLTENKSTGSCSKGSNKQQIVEQSSKADFTVREIYYLNPIFRKAYIFLLQGPRETEDFL